VPKADIGGAPTNSGSLQLRGVLVKIGGGDELADEGGAGLAAREFPLWRHLCLQINKMRMSASGGKADITPTYADVCF